MRDVKEQELQVFWEVLIFKDWNRYLLMFLDAGYYVLRAIQTSDLVYLG